VDEINGDDRTCECLETSTIVGGPFQDSITLHGAETFTGCRTNPPLSPSDRVDEIITNPQNLESFLEYVLAISDVTFSRDGDNTVVVTFTLTGTNESDISLEIGELADLWDVDYEVRSLGNDVYEVRLDYDVQIADSSNQLLVSVALSTPLLLSRFI
jgi:hypothetical protein